MSEIRNTLSVFKARCPEVILLIGLRILALLSSVQVQVPETARESKEGLPFVIFSVSVTVIATILMFGFLRTVYLEGKRQCEPIVLLITGRRFFLRLLVFSLLLAVVFIPLFVVTFLSLEMFVFANPDFVNRSIWIHELSMVLPMIVLLKPVLLIPALIIVLDCGLIQSLNLLKICVISRENELLGLYILQILLPLIWLFFNVPFEPKTIPEYVLLIASSGFGYLVSLMIAVIAVRYVATVDLVYDGETDSHIKKD